MSLTVSRVLVWAAVVCITGSAALAHVPDQQDPIQQPGSPAPPERGTLKTHQYDVVVSGCVKGKRLERAFIHSPGDDLPFSALNAESFSLDGPKELLKQIADEHRNHFDQVIGIATVPPSMSRAQSEVKSKRIGPISIGIGGRQETSPLQSAPQTIKLTVSSFVHVENVCASR
jgi:hypothetical protein